MAKRRDKGEGSVYQRPGSNVWYIQYKHKGRTVQKSSGSKRKKDALKLLSKLKGEIITGTHVHGMDRITVAQLCEAVVKDYEIRKLDTLPKAKRSSKQVTGFFGHLRAVDIDEIAEAEDDFIAKRRSEGLSDASVNRELAFLKRAFGLAIKKHKIIRKPTITMLDESNVRQGFFEISEFLTLRENCPEWFKPIVTFGYFVPWRWENVIELEWRFVDLENRKILIPAEYTKSGKKPVKVSLDGELLELLQDLQTKRDTVSRFVFTKNGDRLPYDCRKVWQKACVAAGLGRFEEIERKGKKIKRYSGRIFHDLRRSGIRDYIRSGTPERVVMDISGHLTRSTFDRYNISSDKDIEEAAERRNRYAQEQAEKARKVVPFNKTNG